MHMPTKAPPINRLLGTLPPEEMEILRPHLTEVPLIFRERLYEAGEPIRHVWFPNSGVVSMVTELAEGDPVELATIGPEGMVGIALILGSERMENIAFNQIAGDALRMDAAQFRSSLERCPALHRLLLRYTAALMQQISQGAACNRMHTVEERCARWLLMTHDRVYKPNFLLTQEFLGQMLGVRRPTVSLAAGMLQKAGLIHYSRGEITICDREGLEAAACECYEVIRKEFERLVGAPG